MDVAADGELDVAQLVGHCVAVFGVQGAVEVLPRSEEPVECDDGQVDDVGPARVKLRVGVVEHFDEGLKDGDVDRVGARARAIFLLEACAVFDPGSALGWRCDDKACSGHLGSDPPIVMISLHTDSICSSTVKLAQACYGHHGLGT